MSFTNTVNGTRENETWLENNDGSPFAIYHVHTTKENHLPKDDPQGLVCNPDIISKVNIRWSINFES